MRVSMQGIPRYLATAQLFPKVRGHRAKKGSVSIGEPWSPVRFLPRVLGPIQRLGEARERVGEVCKRCVKGAKHLGKFSVGDFLLRRRDVTPQSHDDVVVEMGAG